MHTIAPNSPRQYSRYTGLVMCTDRSTNSLPGDYCVICAVLSLGSIKGRFWRGEGCTVYPPKEVHVPTSSETCRYGTLSIKTGRTWPKVSEPTFTTQQTRAKIRSRRYGGNKSAYTFILGIPELGELCKRLD